MNALRGSKFKFVMLGDGRVGKTSLALRYVNNTFTENQWSTVGASFLEKRVSCDGEACTLQIWDTAGQEQYANLVSMYYRDADAAVITYDISRKESFERVLKWADELEARGPKNCVVAIVGNKADLAEKREIPADAGAELAEKLQGREHFFSVFNIETSAKLPHDDPQSRVNELFEKVTSQALQARKEKEKEDAGNPATVNLHAPASGKSDGGCCGGSKAPPPTPAHGDLKKFLRDNNIE